MKKNLNTKNFTYSWFIFLICTITSIIVLEGFFEYKNSVKEASIRTNNLTILLSKKIESDFEQVNNLLKFAQNIIINSNSNELEKKELISKRFDSLKNSFRNISALNFADVNGNIIYSSTGLTNEINISDREHFSKLKNNKDISTSFSDVIVSRTTKEKSLAITRAIRDEKGNLLGILSALIDIKTINKSLASINLGKDGVALLRRSDNTNLISRYPLSETVDINQPLPSNNPIVTKIRNGEKTGTLEYIASTDGKKRVGSYIVMEEFPFYVQTAISEEEYLAQWKNNLKVISIFLVLFILLTFLIFYILNKSFKKEQLAIKELLKNQDLFSSGTVITLEWIPENNWPIKYISSNCENILGYTQNEMLSKDFNYSNLIHPEDKHRVYLEVKEFINKNIDSFEQSYRIQLKDGTYKYFYDYTKVVRNKDEKIVNFIGYIFDQTNLKEKEESLIIEKNRFKNMFKNHASIMLLIDPNSGEIIDANQSAINFYGYSLEELKQMNISKINQANLDEIIENYKKAKNSIKKSFIFSHKLKNGEIKIVEVHSSPIETTHGVILFSIIKDITKEQELENEILKEKIKFQTFINLSSDAIFILDENGKLLEYSLQTQRYLGYSDEEMKNLSVLDWDENIKSVEEFKELLSNLFHKQEITFIEKLHKRKDGSYYNASINITRINLDGKNYIYSSARDITNEKNIQKKLQESYTNLEKLIEAQNNIVILTDGKEIKFANHKFFDFLGFKNLDKFKESHHCICEFFIENDKFFHLKKINSSDSWLKEIIKLEESKRVVSMIGKDLEQYAFSVNISKFDDDTMIVSFTDISQTIFINMYLEEKILHDKLTNAYNREFFDRNYRKFINEYHKNHTKLALAILDIDYFKKVNDTFGHDVGDDVLIEFVSVIQNHSRKDDLLIRWGGEEFILILQLNSQNDFEKILEHLRNAIEIHTFPKVEKITCSIGGTIYQNNENILNTIKRADEAVYKAKAAGRNRILIY